MPRTPLCFTCVGAPYRCVSDHYGLLDLKDTLISNLDRVLVRNFSV